MRIGIAATACVLSLLLAAAEAAPGNDLQIRIEGKVLRKASGRLVLSLSSFELSGAREVSLENRKTGEKRTFVLSSVYRDLCYTEPLPPGDYDAIEPGDWLPHILWTLPDDPDALRARLSSIYEYQNELRRELGRALLEEGGESLKVTSRLTLNKIEKFHRIAAVLAAESLRIAREGDGLGSFLFPLQIRIGFNPFGSQAPRSRASSLHEVGEVFTGKSSGASPGTSGAARAWSTSCATPLPPLEIGIPAIRRGRGIPPNSLPGSRSTARRSTARFTCSVRGSKAR